jgi:transposase
MGMPQLVVAAVLVEGRSKSAVARDYGVSRRWVITLVKRYLAEGDPGLDPPALPECPDRRKDLNRVSARCDRAGVGSGRPDVR